MLTGRFLVTGLVLVSMAGWAADKPMKPDINTIDSKIDLAKLKKKKNILVRSDRNGYVMNVHASTVMALDAEKFVRAITSYGRYIEWKMPTLRRVQVLENRQGRRFLTWNWISVMGVHSKHCLEAERSSPSPDASEAWVKWRLKACPKKAALAGKVKPDPEYRDKPAFRNMHGTFYIKKLPGKTPLIYVRYYTSTKLSKTIPPSIVHLISRFRLKSDIRSMLRVLARAAGTL